MLSGKGSPWFDYQLTVDNRIHLYVLYMKTWIWLFFCSYFDKDIQGFKWGGAGSGCILTSLHINLEEGRQPLGSRLNLNL